MSVELVLLALLMGAVTYPSRALPLLAPGLERLPPRALEYLRLVGPAVLAALAAVNIAIVLDPARRPSFQVGIEWLAVAVCIALVAWRRNLFVGVIAAAILVAVARASGAG
ncbi:MAG: AzlD domain-containing protein [Chloroflexota bacterium]